MLINNILISCTGFPSVKPVGAISYMDINGDRLKRDVLFCYDLKLPEDFVPKNLGKHVLSNMNIDFDPITR